MNNIFFYLLPKFLLKSILHALQRNRCNFQFISSLLFLKLVECFMFELFKHIFLHFLSLLHKRLSLLFLYSCKLNLPLWILWWLTACISHQSASWTVIEIVTIEYRSWLYVLIVFLFIILFEYWQWGDRGI